MRNSKGQFIKGEKRDFLVRGMLGKHQTDKQKETMRKFMTGKKLSPEVIEKIKKSSKGRKVWNKGLKGKQKKQGGYSFGVGENNPNWKGGATKLADKIRKSLEYRLWREAVFRRDNWMCVWCGIKSQKGIKVILHADHIKSFSLYPELRFALDNGRTLCIECHKTTDSYLNRWFKI